MINLRASALLSLLFLLPCLISFALTPGGADWAEYPGVLYHLAMLLVVANLAAPEWAKAAGNAWISLDVLAGTLVISDVTRAIADPIRLGGHVFAGLWIATASWFAKPLAVRSIGLLAGVWLAAYTFLAKLLPDGALAPAGLLTTAWLVMLAVYGTRTPAPATGDTVHG